jgi:hypothetical protein
MRLLISAGTRDADPRTPFIVFQSFLVVLVPPLEGFGMVLLAGKRDPRE